MKRVNRMKRKNRVIRATALTLAALLILLVPGCGGSSDTMSDPPSLSEIDAMKVEVGDFPAQQPAISPSNLLGSISFTPDETRSAQGDYEPDKSLVLEVTDVGGFTWRLEIPEGADYLAQTITMTPLRDLKSDVLGAVSSGVRLEPDGLYFLKPVLLSVKGPGIGDGTILLSGDHGGGNLGFIPRSEGAEGLGAEIWHFSSAFSCNPDPGLKELSAEARRARDEALDAAAWMSRQPISVPVPPDLSYKCKDNSCKGPDTGDLERFMEKFLEPERTYLDELFKTERNYQLTLETGTGTEFSDPRFLKFVQNLNYRYIRKVKELITLYKYRPEKCMAVTSAAIKSVYNNKLFNSDYAGGEIIGELAHWHEKTFEHYLAELRDGHDFKSVHAMFRVMKNAAFLGADENNMLDRLNKAMHFTVRFKNDLTGQGAAYYLSGEIDVPFVFPYNANKSIFSSSGKGGYTNVQIPYGAMKLPNEFPVLAGVMAFDTCRAESVEVYIDRFGAEKETYVAGGYAIPTVGAVDRTTKAFLYDMAELSSVPLSGTNVTCYKFILPFQNKNEIVAEKTYRKALEMQLAYTVELWHTPK